MKKIALALFLSVAALSAVQAQNPKVVVSDKTGWHKIGETTVDFTREREEVLVLGANRFASLIFKVDDAPIDLVEIEIFYESGDNQKVSANFPIKAPGQSKEIDLNGGERNIKKIVFVYKTLPNNKDKKAHVEIWGLKTNTDKNKSGK